MIQQILSAFTALPRIASALEGIAESINEIDQRNRQAAAAKRRTDKDRRVDAAVDAIIADRLQDDEAGERDAVDGAE